MHEGIEPDLSEHLFGLFESLKQLEETARGFKEYMERQGWTAPAAEQVGVNLLNALISTSITPSAIDS